MSKRIIKYLFVIIIILLIGYFGYHFIKKYLTKEDQKKSMPPTAVTVAKAQQQQWYDQIRATGTMSAFQGIMIQPVVNGNITKIYFEDGTFIEEGQPIVQIYPDIVEAQLARDKAAQELAQLDYERGVELYKKRVISRQDFDTLTSNLQQTEAQVAQTEAQLTQYNILAPFSGMLGLRLVDLGSYVTIGTQIVQLQQIDPIRVEFYIPEIYLSELALNQTVEVAPSNIPGYTAKGNIYAFDSTVNPNNRSLAIRARVPNADHKLIPGTFAEVTVYAGQLRPVISVPQTAIEYSTEGLYVYVVENDKAVKTDVTIGQRKGNEVEVKTGLKAGDTVVIGGQVKLIPNAPVTIKPTKQQMQQQAQQFKQSQANDASTPSKQQQPQQQPDAQSAGSDATKQAAPAAPSTPSDGTTQQQDNHQQSSAADATGS